MEQFIYFVLGTIAAVIINLITPRLLRWLEDQSLVNTQKRRKALEEERAFITQLRANGSMMISFIMRDITLFLAIFAVDILLIGTAIILQSLAYEVRNVTSINFLGNVITNSVERQKIQSRMENSVWVLVALAYLLVPAMTTIAFRSAGYTRKVLKFDRYEEEMGARIKQLEQNPNSQTQK